MKKSQIRVFEELLKDETFAGKRELRYLLWRNTATPKFKVGQYVKVTNTAHRIYGHPVIAFKAKITKISSYLNQMEWHYEMEMDITCGDKHSVINEYALESDIRGGVRNNLNVLPAPKSAHADSIAL